MRGGLRRAEQGKKGPSVTYWLKVWGAFWIAALLLFWLHGETIGRGDALILMVLAGVLTGLFALVVARSGRRSLLD